MNDISVFFPLRAGSQRSKNKNTRPFLPDGRSLFQLKMAYLQNMEDYVQEIVVSTNDPLVVEQFIPFESEKIRLVQRPEELCLSSTKVVDLINYVPTVVGCSNILWLHATAPFFTDQDYLTAIKMFDAQLREGSADSVMSVNKIQQFIWSSEQKKVINVNRDLNPWPNTQDLEPLFEINHAFYISTRDNYLKYQDRIGINPALYLSEGEKKIDIDWEEDFVFAQRVAEVYGQNYGW